MIVWEPRKDDQQYQWEKMNCDSAPTLHALTDRHQIWNLWKQYKALSSKNFDAIRKDISSLHMR